MGRIQRAGERLQYIGSNVRAVGPRSAAAVDWWLSGGIAGANCIAAYQPKGAASLAASYSNLANPGTYDASPGSAPNFGANGWIFDTNGMNLTTGISPASSGWGAATFLTTTSSGEGVSGRAFSNNDTFMITPNNGDVNIAYRNGGVVGSAPAATNGTSIVLGFAQKETYRNGINDGTISAGDAGATAVTIGNRAALGRTLKGTIHALAFYDSITEAQLVAVQTAMAVL